MAKALMRERGPEADKPPVPGAAAPVTTPAALKAVMAGTSRKKKSAF
jgi:hypothetical protein